MANPVLISACLLPLYEANPTHVLWCNFTKPRILAPSLKEADYKGIQKLWRADSSVYYVTMKHLVQSFILPSLKEKAIHSMSLMSSHTGICDIDDLPELSN